MNEVNKYQEALGRLQDKRAKLIERSSKLAEERAAISFEAHASEDERAQRRLKQIHQDIVSQESELASIDAAIATATEKLRFAESEHAREQDRTEALAARAMLHELMDNGAKLNEAMAQLVSELDRQKLLFEQLRALGVQNPQPDMIRVKSAHCVSTALMLSGIQKQIGSEFLSPAQRADFQTLYARWAEAIDRELSRRIGDEKISEAA
jgi:chromosome segregation ATPase